MDWTAVAALTALCGIGGTIFSYAVTRPLNESIASLKASIDHLNVNFEKEALRRQEMDKRLVIVEQSIKSAHHRIDNLERR